MDKLVETRKMGGLGMEDLVSWLLRGGVTLSAAVLSIGALLFLVTGQSGYGSHFHLQELIAYRSRLGGFPTTIPAIVQGVADLKPFAVIQLGVILLIATPVARVGASIFLFLAERDYLYVLITTFVFLILLISIFGVR
ncbi:MAG: DUF1634 domain-containing protein [Chloroflexi bacterium]|nr:DUF1634 domain-containing protein [Chloroflexota bacterium]MCL5076048.1 DUF1634 domain-containing protein [Chloroflexota bacterium]